MTLHCWMHWFWITLWTVITVLPPATLGLPIPQIVGEPSVNISPILHQLPVQQTTERRAKSIPINLIPNQNTSETPASAKEELHQERLANRTPTDQNQEERRRPSDPNQERSKSLDQNQEPSGRRKSLDQNQETRRSKEVLSTGVITSKDILERNQEILNRKELLKNRTPVEDSDTSGGSFPVPQVDDSGDSEGGLPLDLAAAAVGLKPPEKGVTHATFTSPGAEELELRYNAVIADTVSSPNHTEDPQPDCTDCSTTLTPIEELPSDLQNITEVAAAESEIDAERAQDASGAAAPQPGEDSTEEVLSRSSLATVFAVQESREQTSDAAASKAMSNHALEPSSLSDEHGMDPGAIAGISLAALALASLASAASFVLYRRRYLNNPQTLSDKCSNPDSSGYIDDSTMRENSEEMYSLDNDSFLNSLEAMTIQNYWTDSVKHTKL